MALRKGTFAILIVLLCLCANAEIYPPGSPITPADPIDVQTYQEQNGDAQRLLMQMWRMNFSPLPGYERMLTVIRYDDGQVTFFYEVNLIPPLTAYVCQASTPWLTEGGAMMFRTQELSNQFGTFTEFHVAEMTSGLAQ